PLPGEEVKPPAAVHRLTVQPGEVRLTDSRSRQQLLVTAHAADGYLLDATRHVAFEAADPGIARVDAGGIVRPVKGGTTRVRVTGLGQAVEVPVAVGNLAKAPPVSFSNEVMAVLGKAGCNSGACHGHNSGKGGFKLSLRGYDPAADHKALRERVDLDDPDLSKILLKPTEQVAHRGGKRFDVDSDFYTTLRQWLAQKAEADV